MDPNIPTQPVVKKQLPLWLTTVTPLSKLLAMILFLGLPFLGFYLGMQYQQRVTVITPTTSVVQKTITLNPTPLLNTNTANNSSPTIDPTANWKTYNSPDNAFALKYPNDSNWNLTEVNLTHSTSFDIQCPHINCPQPYNVYDFGGGISNINSIDKYTAAFNTINPAGSSNANSYIQDYQKIKINGLDAVETLVDSGKLASSGPIITVFVVNKGQGYSFGYTYTDENLNTTTKLGQLPPPNPDFISTLKFIN